MQILCIMLRYNKPNKSENHKSTQFTHYVSLIKLELRFYSSDFDILSYKIAIYKRIPNRIRIPIFSSEYVIDSGAGLILSIWFILILVLNSMQKHSMIVKLMIWVWCGIAIMNGQFIYVSTNKSLTWYAAELCFAKS